MTGYAVALYTVAVCMWLATLWRPTLVSGDTGVCMWLAPVDMVNKHVVLKIAFARTAAYSGYIVEPLINDGVTGGGAL